MRGLILALGLAGAPALAQGEGEGEGEDEAAPESESEAAPESESEAAPEPESELEAREADIFGSPSSEEAAREADMFGSPSSEEAAREADMFGSSTEAASSPASEAESAGLAELETTLSDADIAARLDAAESRLTVGGLLYLRADLAVPDVDELELEDIALSSPNLLDLFADARPNDRVRAFARARLRHSLTVRDGDVDELSGEELAVNDVILDQLWLNFDVGRRVFITAGRQRIKWGAGRFWNPTDFLQPARLDALANFDERTGVGIVKVHVPARPLNLYVIGDFEGADALDEVGGAARAELLVGLTEMALSGALRKDQTTRLGAEVTTGVWLVDLRGELAWITDVESPGWEGSLDLETLSFPTEVDRSEDGWLQAMGGAEMGIRLNDEDTLYLGAEYFHNQLGTDDPDLYPWLLAQEQFTPFYVGQDYLGAYATLFGPGRGQPWNDMRYVLSYIRNLSDGSSAVRLDYGLTMLTELSLNAYVAQYMGDQGEFHLRLEVPGLVTGGEDLVIPATSTSAGLGLSLDF